MSFIFKGSLDNCAIQQEKLDGSEHEESDQELTNRKCLEENNKNNNVIYRKHSKVRYMINVSVNVIPTIMCQLF